MKSGGGIANLTARDIDNLTVQQRQDLALENAAQRLGEPIEIRTPADFAMLREELAAFDQENLQLVTELEGDRWALYSTWLNVWFDFVFADGPTILPALRRLYTLARRYRPDLIAHMNGTEVSLMWGAVRATESARLQQLFDGLKTCGVAGFRGGGAKREGARRKFSSSARGNKNRARGKSKKQKAK